VKVECTADLVSKQTETPSHSDIVFAALFMFYRGVCGVVKSEAVLTI
jgi:hypothetical protein